MSLNNIVSNEIIGIYIGNTNIKILLGNKNKIKQFMSIKTPENSVQDYNIIDIEAIVNCLNMFFKQNKITAKNVAFAIQGQEIIIRHVELPIMPEKNIRSAIEWETNQFLPNNGAEHYIDFEILDKVYSNDKKAFKIMVAAVPKEKVDKYLRLSEILNLRLKAIDLTANCTARLFKNIAQKDKEVKNIGVIDIGSKNSSIVIIENGKLFMEKTVPFGLFNIQREISKKKNISLKEAEEYMLDTLNFYEIEAEDEITKRMQTLFDNLFSSFSKVIQFYTTGKASKKLDRIYLSSGGNLIKGLNKYINDYFETETMVPDNFKAMNLKIAAPKDFELKFYANIVGLLLRRETK